MEQANDKHPGATDAGANDAEANEAAATDSAAARLADIERITSRVAHDFNNLLVVILSNAHLLRTRLGHAHPGLEELNDITHASERACELARALLELRPGSWNTAADPSQAQPAARLDSAASHKTILIAEDDQCVRRTVESVVRNAGYQVIVTCDGEEAFAASTQHAGSIDLLLTDIVMPGMSGILLAEKLQERRPGLRVLMMSGYTGDVAANTHRIPASAAFLQKPFTPDALLGHIERALTSR